MTTREEAARLADALEQVYPATWMPDDRKTILAAAALLRQWPDAAPQEPVALQHVAVAEDGVLRWMSGRKLQECELYAMPDGGNAPALYAAPQPGWMPIESAPMHTEVLVWREDSGPFIAKLTTPDAVIPDDEMERERMEFPDDFEEWWSDAYGWQEGSEKPSHWMPLPPPPGEQPAAQPAAPAAKLVECHWCSGTGIDGEQCSDGYHGGGTCPECKGACWVPDTSQPAAPAQPAVEPLTDEQIRQISDKHFAHADDAEEDVFWNAWVVNFARAIIAADRGITQGEQHG